MSRFATMATLNVLDAIPDAWVDEVKNFHDYFTQAGANLSVLGGSNTLTITSRWHAVTLAGGNNIDNITDASTAQAGQVVELQFAAQQTIRTSGNISTASGQSYVVSPNELVRFVYDGAEWWLIGGGKTIGYSSQFDVVNTAALTTIFTQSIPAGLLGPMGALKFDIVADYLNNSTLTKSFLVQIIFGGTTMWGMSNNIATSAQHKAYRMSGVISNENVTNAQRLAGHATFSGAGNIGSVAGLGDLTLSDYLGGTIGGSAAVDTTLAQTLVIQVQYPTALATLEFKGTVHVQVVP